MFLFPKFSPPNWKLSFSIIQQFYTLGRLLCKTIHSIRLLHLKTSSNRQLPKKKQGSQLFSEKEAPNALSASEGEDGRAISVLIWSHTNMKIMARPTTSTVSRINCLAYKRKLRWRKTWVRVHILKIHVKYREYTALLKD